MNQTRWLVAVTIISIISHLINSKFVDITSNYIIDNELDTINLDDNEIVSEAFETSQHQIRYKTQQKYKNIPIFGATLVITQHNEDNKHNIPIFGKWYDKSDIEQLIPSIEPKFNKDQTLQIGLNDLDINFSDLYSTPTCNLYIYYDKSVPFLCWILKFSYLKQLQQQNETENYKKEIHHPTMIINALNGNILEKYDELYDIIEACGDGGTETTGLYKYCVDKAPLLINNNINPVLQNNVIQVYDNMGWSYPDPVANLVTCSNLVHSRCNIDDGYTNGAYCPACDAYAFGNIVIEMFDEWTNATYPISPPLKLYVHVDGKIAGYNRISGFVYFGDGDSTHYPLTSLDIIAHEIAHGYTVQGSNLIYSGQSGAMNEAFSDITGEAAKYFYLGQNDWKVGAKISKHGSSLRYMYDPPLDGVSIGHYNDYYSGIDVHFGSGLFNKAAYILNTNNNWNMEQIFRVFAWANLYYWTSDSTFGEGISGLYHALYDIYDDNITDVNAMADVINISFSTVGLSQITVPISGESCGVTETRLCWNENIYPSQRSNTNHTITVKAADSWEYLWGNLTYLDIYFIINDNDCIQPSLSLTYELIDFDASSEYIEVFDNDGVLINRCQGGQSCGVYDSLCINNYNLSVPAVKIGERYKITVVESYAVDPLCGGEITLNALFILHCNAGTLQPTMEPSINPTIEPTSPTMEPSTAQPTAFTLHPTDHPTTFPIATICPNTQGIISCNTKVNGIITNGIEHCYTFIPDSVSTVTFSNCESNFDTKLFVYNKNAEEISQPYCDGDDCGSCGTNEQFSIPQMNPNETYYILIDSFSSYGGGNYTIDVQCYPIYPNVNCGVNTFCYDIDIYPSLTQDVVNTVIIQNPDENSETYFNVFFMIHNNDCVSPQLSFEYEQIDYDSSSEYIDIFDNNNNTITRCGGSFNQCNQFSQCLVDFNIGLAKIIAGQQYSVRILKSANVDALCSHSNSINARLTLTCQTGTAYPTPQPTNHLTTEPICCDCLLASNVSAPTRGCNINPQCEHSICGFDQFCCNDHWDKTCVFYASEQCTRTQPKTTLMSNTIDTTISPNVIFDSTTTADTISSIYNETRSKPLCKADKCYYEYVKQTNIMTQIINYDNINAYLFDIYYLFEDYECNNPRLTFEYEKIDIDRVSEYISISANDTFIAECGTGVNKCGEMKQCFSNKTFGINIISIGESLKISIVVSKNSNALCETDMHQIYTINGELTLICNDKITSVNNNNSNKSLFIKMNININTIIIFSVCIFFICILLFTIVWCCTKNRKQKHKQSEDEILDYIDSQLEMTHNKTPSIMNDEQKMMEDDEILQQMHDTILLDEETTL